MKYEPKKVFILEGGQYVEITYQELLNRERTKAGYKDKLFLPMYGMLMEVTEEFYRDYYKNQEREKYIVARSIAKGDISYHALDSEEFNGEDILVDIETDVAEQVMDKLLGEKLKVVFSQLKEKEQKLIYEIYTLGRTERELAVQYGISQVAIHKRKNRILQNLKKLLES